MPKVQDIHTLDEIIVWAVDHDSYISVWWKSQHEWNPKQEKKMELMAARITALEKRLVFVAGGASAIGSGLGLLLLRFLGG